MIRLHSSKKAIKDMNNYFQFDIHPDDTLNSYIRNLILKESEVIDKYSPIHMGLLKEVGGGGFDEGTYFRYNLDNNLVHIIKRDPLSRVHFHTRTIKVKRGYEKAIVLHPWTLIKPPKEKEVKKRSFRKHLMYLPNNL